jgi:glycogen debranching enzyme
LNSLDKKEGIVFLHIIHSLNNKKVDEHIVGEAAFLLTNKKGNYLSLGGNNFSHTQGLFFFDKESWSPYKTIESIRIDAELVSIRNNFYDAERSYKGGAEENFVLFNNSMLYTLRNYSGEVLLELDFRHLFDFDDKGRIYSITKEDDLIIIRYDKFKDDSLSVIDKTWFIAIKGLSGSLAVPDFKIVNQWVRKNYSYDESRHSRSEFYVYQALKLQANNNLHLVFSFSKGKEEAKSHARQIFEDKEYVVGSMHKYALHAFASGNMALSAAMKALDDLVTTIDANSRTVGIFAGLPWFYQFWSRDELISLKALMLQDKHPLVKSILFHYLRNIGEDGLLPNRLPSSNIKSIDAVGWLFLRVNEFLELLSRQGTTNDYLSLTEIITIKKMLEKAISSMLQNHVKNNLVINESQETWMDTRQAARKGACIEIQALFLAMLKMHNSLAKMTRSKQTYKSTEKEFRDTVREEFFKDNALLDCVGGELIENAVRPNLFLAYYAYPELLSKLEWKAAFDNALKSIWLDWGGVSSINHNNHLFKSEYTGEEDSSYHNGDSWYYVNNYAAIALHRVDKEYYSKQIERIAHASQEELLFSGFIGCCAEVSSAKMMKSQGCLSQAWSNASFIELMHEIGRK